MSVVRVERQQGTHALRYTQESVSLILLLWVSWQQLGMQASKTDEQTDRQAVFMLIRQNKQRDTFRPLVSPESMAPLAFLRSFFLLFSQEYSCSERISFTDPCCR
jgi:hypothetical protein